MQSIHVHTTIYEKLPRRKKLISHASSLDQLDIMPVTTGHTRNKMQTDPRVFRYTQYYSERSALSLAKWHGKPHEKSHQGKTIINRKVVNAFHQHSSSTAQSHHSSSLSLPHHQLLLLVSPKRLPNLSPSHVVASAFHKELDLRGNMSCYAMLVVVGLAAAAVGAATAM